MNRLIRVIFLNLLNFFDINKIIIARNNNVKSEFESKAVIAVATGLLYGYIIYRLFIILSPDNKIMILNISFILSTIICFVSSLMTVTPVVLKTDDSDLLFSMPLSVNQVLFAKLFQVYVKNILYTAIVMITGLLAYYSFVKEISDTFVLMYLLMSLVIPFIPLVLSTIIMYMDASCNLKYDKKLYGIIRVLVVLLFILLVMTLFVDVTGSDLNSLIGNVYLKIKNIFPLVVLFNNALVYESALNFVALLFVPSLVLVIFNMILSNKYLDICSKLKGIGKKNKFVYKKSGNYKKHFGLLRKELRYLFGTKIYLKASLGPCLLLTIVFIGALFFINPEEIMGPADKVKYFYNRIPAIIAMMSCFSVPAIASISLEKRNVEILRTLPIRTKTIMFSKWFASVLVGSVFIIINSSVAWYFFDLPKGVALACYLYSLWSLMFVSFTSLFLDYVFVDKSNMSDSEVVKGRILTIVPTIIAIIIGMVPILTILTGVYNKLLIAYCLVMIIFLIIEFVYLTINKKVLEENLYS